jgi:hypothetical protein
MAVSKLEFVADGVDAAVISGLPTDCWLRVNSDLVHITDGSYTLSTTEDLTAYDVELLGQFYASKTLRITAIAQYDDLIRANSRWQNIMEASPEQIQAWANTNITDLASARNVMVSLFLVVRRLYEKSQLR